ncbi:hypothetical protein BMETH_161_4 [methanotrophic bacterial endosymbiont of Bathymodiolus sp.]|nr:hypothetical protein BMETH_161_4 [methanotrophic bacterial endosymbiont of Bathymodiolus sp.]
MHYANSRHREVLPVKYKLNTPIVCIKLHNNQASKITIENKKNTFFSQYPGYSYKIVCILLFKLLR